MPPSDARLFYRPQVKVKVLEACGKEVWECTPRQLKKAFAPCALPDFCMRVAEDIIFGYNFGKETEQ